MTEQPEAGPCPFCGHRGRVAYESGHLDKYFPRYFCKCASGDCRAKGRAFLVNGEGPEAARRKAVEWWNRRPKPDIPPT